MSNESARSQWASSLRLWEGPESLSTDRNSASNFVYGWQVLRLAVRTDNPRVLETRSVYADTRDSEQPKAILRAAYWHSRPTGVQPGTALVAARFVEVPIAMALPWIGAFDGVMVGPQRNFDDDAPVRILRVEWDYVSSAYEVVWQGGELEHSDLSRAWHRIWNEMGAALSKLPEALDVEEDWPVDLTRLDEPPFTTSRTSSVTGYELSTYPPIKTHAIDP